MITYIEFAHALQRREWKVDTNLDHDHLHDVLPSQKPPTEEAAQINGDSEGEGEEEADSDGVPKSKGPAPFPGNISPRKLWDLKRALIIKTSHIGGHKFAGNVIVSEQPLFFCLTKHGAARPFASSRPKPWAWIPILSYLVGGWLPHSLLDVTHKGFRPSHRRGYPNPISPPFVRFNGNLEYSPSRSFRIFTRYLSRLVPYL